MKKWIGVFLVFAMAIQSCQYKPFLKYYFPSKKTHLAKFTQWDKEIGSNSNPLRACYNITCYNWLVNVHPDKKEIDATMKIYFQMECNQDSIMLDLQKQMHIDDIKSSETLKKIQRKKDALFVIFDREIQKGEKVLLEISYHGTPVNLLKNSAINWKKDKNNDPWICTVTQGLGPHHMMPCKNLLNDEPDSCFIRVGVPKNLVAVANGKLDGITETATSHIYHWAVRNPINVYNISFNVGNYVKLEKDYTDIENNHQKIQIYALQCNQSIADTFYNQSPIIMQKLENLYGIYPWWKDGCKIIESCLSDGLCMEHQSAISMSDAYYDQYHHINYTLVHELSHEWWGNSVTAYDYADLWLHEGFATYSELLVAEALGEKKYFDGTLNYFTKVTTNKGPIVKPYDVWYNTLVHQNDQDIYNKGALFLHTLRMQLNDDALFFKTLKELQFRYSKSNLTSQQFLLFLNEKTKKDFTPFFEVYLNQISPPVLEYFLDKTNADSTTMEYRWGKGLSENFTMKLVLQLGEASTTIYPTTQYQSLKFPSQQKGRFDMVQFGYILYKEIKE